MIKLSIPSASEDLYINISGFLVGPFGQTGTPASGFSSTRSIRDKLEQGKKMYDENDVVHVKYEGDFRIIPGYKDITSSPRSNAPKSITFACKSASTGKNSLMLLSHGLAVSGRAVSSNVNDRFFLNIAVISSSPRHVEYVEILAQRSFPKLSPQVNKYRYEVVSSTRKLARVRQTHSSVNFEPSLINSDWITPRSYGEIILAANMAGGKMNVSPTLLQAETFLAKTPASVSPKELYTSIDSLIVKMMSDSEFSLSPVHFGDLASKASEGVNRNNVNMIAFLKDLRNPKDMIPKLKNLTSLKTHSSNYLATIYGILPTISDLQNIFGALQKVKPYVDKHGFSTYNAVHRDFSTFGVYSYELEQRIKIAIDDEDSQFVALLNRLESSGFSPTFTNIWDLVPYSFVLDWFIDVGSFLERIDTKLRIQRMNIRYVTKSTKQISSTISLPGAANAILGTLSVVNYQRRTDDHCPLPPLSLSSENKLPDHWLEASALLIQRAK